MNWASKNHIYRKGSSDIPSAEAEFENLKSQYQGTGVEGSIYDTSDAQGLPGRLIYIGSNDPLPMGEDWTHKDKSNK